MATERRSESQQSEGTKTNVPLSKGGARQAEGARGSGGGPTEEEGGRATEPSRLMSPSEAGRGHTRGLSRRERELPVFSALESMPFSPFSFVRRMMEDMDRLLSELGTGRGSSLPEAFSEGRGAIAAVWAPQVEMFQRGDLLLIRVELPGLDREDVHIDVDDDGLVIEGERQLSREDTSGGVYRTERRYGSFRRYIRLPDGVQLESATARLENGVLEISVKRLKETSERRRLEIQGGGADGGREPKSAPPPAGSEAGPPSVH